MNEAEPILAATRLDLRRSTPGWTRESDALGGTALLGAGFEEIGARIAQAARVHEISRVEPSNRLRGLKCALLRLGRFVTDRQEHFNRSLTQATQGLFERLAHLTRRSEEDHARLHRLQEDIARQTETLQGMIAAQEQARRELHYRMLQLEDAIRKERPSSPSPPAPRT